LRYIKGVNLKSISLQLIPPVVSAFLLVLAYPSFNIEFLAWIALVPLFFGLENSTIKQRILKGYAFGIVFFSGILYWLFKISIPGTIGLVLLLSVAPVIFSFLYPSGSNNPFYMLLYIPSAWVLTEYLRGHLFTGFPWALLGYSQSFNTKLIQIVDITGVYGLSFLIVAVNFGLLMIFCKKCRRYILPCIVFILVAGCLLYGEIALRHVYPAQTLKIALIQGNIPQDIKWDKKYRSFIMDKFMRITRTAISEGKPDLVVWPETALPGYMEERDLGQTLSEIAQSGNVYFLTGTLHGEGMNAFNSACLISKRGILLARYDKVHLVPLGEFIPFEDKFPWVRSSMPIPLGDFRRGKEYVVFQLEKEDSALFPKAAAKNPDYYKFSCLICYEDIFPEIARTFVEKGAYFLINITNDAWFGKTSAPYQHLQGSIFRAVENHVPVVRAANTGVSCIIDSSGRVTKVARNGKEEICVDCYVTGDISINVEKTFYTRFGDAFSWGCMAIVLLGVITNQNGFIQLLRRARFLKKKEGA